MIQIPLGEYTEEQVNNAIQNACSPGSTFFNWLTLIRLDHVIGGSEWDRGIVEGMRLLAGEIQDRVLMKNKKLEVKSDVRDS